jgi:hypothetical protein
LLVGFLEQTRPKFAWVQIIYSRANIHGQLELLKWRFLQEKELHNPVWVSHIDAFVKKVDEALASDLFAVAVRGIVIGGDPAKLNLSIGDDAYSLAVFETNDPNVIYEMAEQRMSITFPKSRQEPGFFIVNDVSFIAFPPSTSRTAQTVPLGLENILQFEGEEKAVQGEATMIPTIEKNSFHFPAGGVMNPVWDRKIHIVFGGSLEETFRSLGVAERPYNPLLAFKDSLHNKS